MYLYRTENCTKQEAPPEDERPTISRVPRSRPERYFDSRAPGPNAPTDRVGSTPAATRPTGSFKITFNIYLLLLLSLVYALLLLSRRVLTSPDRVHELERRTTKRSKRLSTLQGL